MTREYLELPPEAQRQFDLLAQEPVIHAIDSHVDMFQDDTPIEPTCDTENPEQCEACD